VLTPGGVYFAQHVGGGTNVEISEYFLGPHEPGDGRNHEVEADRARAAGLGIVQCRNERLRLEFFDVGAMVFFLRKVVWTVPDFTVDRYHARLLDLHDQIKQDGVFRSTMSRTLLEARKPLATWQSPVPSRTTDLNRSRIDAKRRTRPGPGPAMDHVSNLGRDDNVQLPGRSIAGDRSALRARRAGVASVGSVGRAAHTGESP
jgi:hypothetical protein